MPQPILNLDEIAQAVASNRPITRIATLRTQAALQKHNRQATKPVAWEYEAEKIIADRQDPVTQKQELICERKNYPFSQHLLGNARNSRLPPSPNSNTPSIDQCQVNCCTDRATSFNPSCTRSPQSVRCSRHTLVACKEATSSGRAGPTITHPAPLSLNPMTLPS